MGVGAVRDELVAVVRDRQRAGLFLGYLLVFVVTDAVAQLLPLYYAALGVPVAALGAAKSVGNALEAVAAGPTGALADRVDRAAIAVVAGAALAVVLAGLPLADSAVTVGALVVGFGLARLVFTTATTPLLSASFEDGSEGVGWAVRDVGLYLGGGLGIVGAGVATRLLGGVGPAFLVLVPAVGLLVAVLVRTHRPSLPRPSGATLGRLLAGGLERPTPLATLRSLSRPWLLARFLALKLFANLATGVSLYLLPVYALDRGVGAELFLLVYGGLQVVSIPFTVAGGLLTDRTSRRALHAGNYAVETVMIAVLAVADGPLLLWAGLGVYVLQTTFEPAVLAYFFDRFAEEEAGTAWGVAGTVARGAGVLAPALGGVLYGVAPRLPFLVGAAAMVPAVLVALTLPPDTDRPPAPGD